MSVRLVFVDEGEGEPITRESLASYRDVLTFIESPLWQEMKSQLHANLSEFGVNCLGAKTFDEKEYFKGAIDVLERVLMLPDEILRTKREEIEENE